jgi:hypothetical protein
MYASFLNLPVEGRHSRALHLELFTVPSTFTASYEVQFFAPQKPRFVLKNHQETLSKHLR